MRWGLVHGRWKHTGLPKGRQLENALHLYCGTSFDPGGYVRATRTLSALVQRLSSLNLRSDGKSIERGTRWQDRIELEAESGRRCNLGDNPNREPAYAPSKLGGSEVRRNTRATWPTASEPPCYVRRL